MDNKMKERNCVDKYRSKCNSGRRSRRRHRRRLQAAPVLAGRSHPNDKFFFQRFSSLLANAVCT